MLKSRSLPALLLAGLAACATAPAAAPPATLPSAPVPAAVAAADPLAQFDTFRARPFDTGRMWTFDFPPLDYLERTYGFRPTQAWLDNVRQSALRFATWCSASFVSPQGLVLTNHHCAVPTFDPAQRPGEDLLTHGFHARTLAEERRVPDLFVEQLVAIEDVTARVRGALEGAGTEQERVARRAEVIRELEAAEPDGRTRYQVVEFYNGGRYSRYTYRRYDDVRLVFAPEQKIAFFGGDPDNFNYPRFNLDMALYRVYGDDGRPLRPAGHLRWSAAGAREGDPVFVVGNPASTQRQFTVAQLEYLRDVQQVAQLAVFRAQRDAIREVMRRLPERGLELRDEFFSIENSIKAITGRREGALDPALFGRKVAFERDFRAAVQRDARLRERYGPAWDSLAALQAAKRRLAPGLLYNAYLNSGALGQALALARALENPENARFRAAALAHDPAPAEEQVLRLTQLLHVAQENVPRDDEILRAVLAGRTPEVAAREIVAGYTLADTAARRRLLEQGASASSPDPVLRTAREVLPLLVARQQALQAITARESLRRADLGQAFFDVFGTDVPPDATFTLRLADGVVKGYEADGRLHPHQTTYYGLYDRALAFNQEGDFDLPSRWEGPPRGLDLNVPFNFVSTNDIIGGNSGSPVVNRNAEVVGLAFDGNLQSLPGNFIFDDTQNRTISVHSAGMLEALRDVYRAQRLVAELTGGR
ncbi:MAG TPA: S46 family peptidase [Longimicrobiaceae bacterium]|nr:S46 family peptidase [Longimicrobiaceae bacterium]